MSGSFEIYIAQLRERYTGFERRDAIPVPVDYLSDLEAHLITGEKIGLPEDVVREGLQVRRIIEATARSVRSRLPQESISNSQIPVIKAMSTQMLADFYIEQQTSKGQPMIFVAGELILPINEGDDGMAGDRAEAIQ